jgi:hypothetical protein
MYCSFLRSVGQFNKIENIQNCKLFNARDDNQMHKTSKSPVVGKSKTSAASSIENATQIHPVRMTLLSTPKSDGNIRSR